MTFDTILNESLKSLTIKATKVINANIKIGLKYIIKPTDRIKFLNECEKNLKYLK